MLFVFGLGLYLGKELYAKEEKKSSNNNKPVEEKKEEPKKDTEKKEIEKEDYNSNDYQPIEENEEEPEEDKKDNDDDVLLENDPVIVKDEISDNLGLSKEEIIKIMGQFYGIKVSNNRLYSNGKFDISDLDDEELFVTVFSQFRIGLMCADKSTLLTVDLINEKLNKYIKKTITLNDIKKYDYTNVGVVDNMTMNMQLLLMIKMRYIYLIEYVILLADMLFLLLKRLLMLKKKENLFI